MCLVQLFTVYVIVVILIFILEVSYCKFFNKDFVNSMNFEAVYDLNVG